MQSTKSATTRYVSIAGRLFALAIVTALAACSNPVDPIGDDDGGVEPVEEAGPRMFNIEMKFKRISVLGDCDGNGILNIKNPGEISYRVAYAFQQADGRFSALRDVDQTSGFGRDDGEKIQKNDDGRVIGISKSASITLEEGRLYELHFSAIEWDGDSRDPRMDGDWAVEENVSGTNLLNQTHELTLGSGSCKLTLHATATETLIQ